MDDRNIVNGILIITNTDGSLTCIPHENCTAEEQLLFDAFNEAYPDGKPVIPVEPTVPEPSELDLLKIQLKQVQEYASATNDNIMAMTDWLISSIPALSE